MPVSESQANDVLSSFAVVLGERRYGGNGEKCPTGRDAFYSGLGPMLVEDYECVGEDEPPVWAVVFESGSGSLLDTLSDVQKFYPGLFLSPCDRCRVAIYPA